LGLFDRDITIQSVVIDAVESIADRSRRFIVVTQPLDYRAAFAVLGSSLTLLASLFRDIPLLEVLKCFPLALKGLSNRRS
jgi:hypothetical protein